MTPKTQREVDAFRAWLEQRGHLILPCKGEWELLRWNGAPGAPPRIMYTNKHGVISNFNCQDATNDWLDFSEEGN